MSRFGFKEIRPEKLSAAWDRRAIVARRAADARFESTGVAA